MLDAFLCQLPTNLFSGLEGCRISAASLIRVREFNRLGNERRGG